MFLLTMSLRENSTVDAKYVPAEHVWRIVRKRLIEAEKKHAPTHNAKHTQQGFQVGEYSWVNSVVRQHQGRKAQRSDWLGPYQIPAKRNPQLYQIAPAPDQATILDQQWLSVDKLWPANVADGAVVWMPMDEDIDLILQRTNYSTPLSRFSTLLNKDVD
jgi:hypothetical protein